MTLPAETDSADAPMPAARPSGGSVGVAAVLLLLLALLTAGGLIGLGVWIGRRGEGWGVLAAGIAAIVAALALTGVASAVAVVGRRLADQAALDRLGERFVGEFKPVRADLDRCVKALEQVGDRTLISDRAKRVAYRDRDRDAVRRAIEEDLSNGDHASARQLADEFEKAFGYKAEAERFREEIRQRVEASRANELDAATARIDRMCAQEQWSDAFDEYSRLIDRFGGDAKVRLIKTRIEERRQQKKVELVKEFHTARRGNDMERAADLLKRLDAYLTPEEGEQLQADAREVFHSRLMSLRDRFSGSMRDRDFIEALRVGMIIRREFPNSKLAKEVASHEPELRKAAGADEE